ncbi:MAG: hypothetical protein LBQ56_08095 [Synergistaceae bacterium]|jgi:hypothetical protein|nr:hypothetical protein [Synergistaceae bacterium]
MGVKNINDMNALFLPAWNDAKRNVRKQADSTDQQRAMEAFAKALRNCDKATERMMDKHHQTVAESAKKIAAYRKKKAVEDRRVQEAENQRLLQENLMIQRINHRNMLEEIRIEELNRRDLVKEHVNT